MRVLVTGVAGQLGHDVMNELDRRGHEGIGTDLAPAYAGVQDHTPVTYLPYVSLDITDAAAVENRRRGPGGRDQIAPPFLKFACGALYT
ncbi:MAG: NAD-dependent epimerase/dehydratase family protein, partial [Lachnospiraceae bacterium]|nr:NAD-dependent epimerase/dehydratase family protein [Lachnospiraceae bacterium]